MLKLKTVYWTAAFKKRKSGKLWWVTCSASTINEAVRKMKEHVRPLKYNLYGGPFLVTE
jgi:hypothetical protein